MIVWTTDPSKTMMLGFSTQSHVQLRLPPGDDITSIMYIIVHIRDNHDCLTKYYMDSIVVVPDLTEINTLVNVLQQSSNEKNGHPLVQLLAGADQNTVAQVVTSLSQVFNKRNIESVKAAVAGKLRFDAF